MIAVERVKASEHELYRTVRLAALAESPAAFASSLAAEQAIPDHRWRSMTLERSRSIDTAVFLARLEGEVVGLAGVHRLLPGDGVAELVQMWVAPGARGSGVGRALVTRVLQWAAKAGFERMELWVVRGNESAAALYHRMGFEPTGEVTPLPSDPCRHELRMGRPL